MGLDAHLPAGQAETLARMARDPLQGVGGTGGKTRPTGSQPYLLGLGNGRIPAANRQGCRRQRRVTHTYNT